MTLLGLVKTGFLVNLELYFRKNPGPVISCKTCYEDVIMLVCQDQEIQSFTVQRMLLRNINNQLQSVQEPVGNANQS